MENKFNYILDLFKTVYGLDFPIEVGYGGDSTSKIQIAQGEIGFFEKDDPHPPHVLWKEWSNEKIPFLFDSDDSKEIVTTSEGRVTINYDIIAASFYFLSGWQEYKSEKKDGFGRFPFSQSIQSKLNIVELPIVNYYFDILKQAVEQVYDKKLKVKLWGESDYATFISHDIDLCESAWKQGSYSELKKGRFLSPFILLAKKMFSRDAWFNFDEILELESDHGVRSTFFFLAEQGHVNNIPNADYNISHSKFESVLKNIEQQGSEIGIHGSLGTSSDAAQLKNEISKLKVDVSGNRFHTLAYDVNTTPGILEAVDITYDASLGFAEVIGFRNSFCFPFYPYNNASDAPYKLLEIPLMIMDATLQHEKYMEIELAEAVSAVQPIVQQVKKFNGCLSILWHNNYFSDYKFKGWREVYQQILQANSKEGTKYMTGQEVSSAFLRSKGNLE